MRLATLGPHLHGPHSHGPHSPWSWGLLGPEGSGSGTVTSVGWSLSWLIHVLVTPFLTPKLPLRCSSLLLPFSS